MAKKIYVIGGYRFQFEEGNQPVGAVEYQPEVKPVVDVKRGRKPANKQVETGEDK